MNTQSSPTEFIAIDVETTGLDVRRDRIVEIAAVRFAGSGEVVASFEAYIHPGMGIPAAATAIHGITDAEVERAPSATEVLPRFVEFLRHPANNHLIAHHASADAGFLGAELRRAGLDLPGHRVFDTLTLARRVHPELRRHRLDSLARSLGLEQRRSHRALADALCVKELWLRLSGTGVPPERLISYPIRDPDEGFPVPHGWEGLHEAITRGRVVWISYEGGSRGLAPRTITPRGFVFRGGEPYVLALCHLSRKDKHFHLGRIRDWQVHS